MDFTKIKNWTINGVEVVKATVGGVVVWVKNRLLKSIAGNSVQDGVPTPSAPVPVVSVGDRTANLIDSNATTYGQNIYVGTTTGLEETSTSYYCTDFIPVQAGKTYTHTSTGLTAHWFYNADKEPTAKVSVPSTSSSVTVPDGCCYMRFNIRNTALPNRLMCNEGEELLDFEPYGYKIPVTVDSPNLFSFADSEKQQLNGLTVEALKRGSYKINGEIETGLAYLDIATDCDFSRCKYIKVWVNNKDKLGDTTKGLIIRFCTSDSRASLLDISSNRLKNGVNNLDVSKVAPNLKNITKKGVIAFRVALSDNPIIIDNLEIKIMGVTEEYKTDDFIPFFEPTNSQIWLKEPLRKVGEYADEITQSGIIRRVIEWELDGVKVGHKITSMGVAGAVNRGILANVKNTVKNLKPVSEKRSVIASNQYSYADVGAGLSTAFLNNTVSTGQLYIVHTDQTITDTDDFNARLAVDKPVFYFPIDDTVDNNFTWDDDINVPFGATITFDTTVQPSDYILEYV